jgi:hypothetical protein
MDSNSTAPTVPMEDCLLCAAPIPVKSQKCKHCGFYKRWYHRLAFSWAERCSSYLSFATLVVTTVILCWSFFSPFLLPESKIQIKYINEVNIEQINAFAIQVENQGRNRMDFMSATLSTPNPVASQGLAGNLVPDPQLISLQSKQSAVIRLKLADESIRLLSPSVARDKIDATLVIIFISEKGKSEEVVIPIKIGRDE